MDPLVNDSLLALPDEVIEYIMSFLSFADLSKLSEAGKRLEDCAKRVSKMKPFRKYNTQIPLSSNQMKKDNKFFNERILFQIKLFLFKTSRYYCNWRIHRP